MTAKTRAALTTQATTNLPDNTSADISPQDVREMFTDTFDSAVVIESDVCYASIYVTGGSTAQTTNGTANTFDKITGFTTNGLSKNCTADAANDKITVTAAGNYACQLCASFSGTGNSTFTVELYNDTLGARLASGVLVRKLGTGGDVGSAALCCLAAINANDDIIARVAADGSSDSFTPEEMTLVMHRLSAT